MVPSCVNRALFQYKYTTTVEMCYFFSKSWLVGLVGVSLAAVSHCVCSYQDVCSYQVMLHHEWCEKSMRNSQIGLTGMKWVRWIICTWVVYYTCSQPRNPHAPPRTDNYACLLATWRADDWLWRGEILPSGQNLVSRGENEHNITSYHATASWKTYVCHRFAARLHGCWWISL